MKKFSMKFLAYWDILAVKVENKNIKKSVQKWAFTYKDLREMLPSYVKCTLQQGQPPLFPYDMEVVEVLVDRSSAEIQAWLTLKTWWPCTTTSKEVETNF